MSSPSQQELTEQAELFYIEAELARHRPWNFVKNFVWTIDEHDKHNPIKQFPPKLMYRVLTRAYLEFDVLFIEKSRQILVSWLFAALMLWDALFYKARRNILQSKKQDDSDALIARATFIYEQLDKIGFPGLPRTQTMKADKTATERKIEFPDQRSMVWSVPQGPDVFRSYTVSNVLADEIAFQVQAKRGYEAAMPAITGGGKYIAPSSANAKVFNWMMLYCIDPATLKPYGPNQVDSATVYDPPYTYQQLEKMDDEEFNRIPFHQLVACVRGMRFWITHSGLPCMRVHYSADPDKDLKTETGQAWYKTAHSKYQTPDGWEREMEINYDTYEGTPVITNFSRDVFVHPCEYEESEAVYLGVDFGTQVNVTFFAQLVNIEGFNFKQLRIFREIVLRNSNTPAQADAILRTMRMFCPRASSTRNFRAMVDAAGHQPKETSASKDLNTSIKIFTNAGIRVVSKKVGRKDGTDLVKSVFARCSPGGHPSVIIDPSCDYCIRVVSGGWHYPHEAKFGTAGEPEKDGEFDHGGETLSYLMNNLFNPKDFTESRKREAPTVTPIREEFTGRIIGYRTKTPFVSRRGVYGQ